MTGRVVRVAGATVVAVALLTGAAPAPASSTPSASATVPAAVVPPTPAVPSPGESSSPPAPAGDPVRAAEYWLDEYGIRDAWQTTRGAGVTIAVIDTGIGRSPIELSGVTAGKDFSGSGSSDGRTPIGAVDGNHGSWVASLAAGRGTGPGAGVIGVAPEAKLLSASIGFGAAATVPFVDQIAQAVRWSVDNGADIINMSFTTNTLDWDPSWDSAFQYAFDHDVVVVVAAGNRGSGTDRVGAPATIPGVLTVAGVDRGGVVSEEASTQGITVGISAPSENLLGVSADGQIVRWNGTSGAAPIISGVAALVRAARPDLDADNVINRIIRTATPAAGATRIPDERYGYGIVDAAAAVSRPLAAVDANPMGDLAEWVRIYRRAEPGPAQAPTGTPVEIPPLPQREDAARASSPLLPDPQTLVYGTVPLLVLTAAGIMVVLGVTAVVRRVRSSRAPRGPRC